jgi:DNA-directed RNA polymerase III subunit RPC6
MLFDLVPSEDITGGAWYTDQELDVAFIEGLTEMTFKFISSKVNMHKQYEMKEKVVKSEKNRVTRGPQQMCMDS